MNQTDLVVPSKDQILTQHWAEAFELWLAHLTESTQRAYKSSWKEFLAFIDKAPWRIGKSDVSRWADELRRQGLSGPTRNQRLAALSSFYTYVCTEYTTVNADDLEVPLHNFNPAAGKSLRSKVNPYGKVSSISADEVQALLAQIPRNTVQGLRDYAMFVAYIYTGRRNSEIRKLRWGNIQRVGNCFWYVWSGKGKVDQRYEMPPPVYEAIVTFLTAAGKLNTIKADDLIFVPVASPNFRPGKPISMREVGRILKKYAAAAGLDDEEIHVHTLRHTAAMLRRQVGDDLQQVQGLLGHTHINTTQIYLDKVEGKPDESWRKIENLIDSSNSS